MKNMQKQKGFIQILLLIIIIGSLLLITQPVQAGFFDWFSFSWSKIKSIFIKEQVQENLPASISESAKEISSPQETLQETSEETQPEIISEVPKETIKESPVKKIIYKDNPEQEIIIQNLKNQIASFQNQIKTLEKQIEDLLSKSPEIKEIVKEIPVEKIVIKEVPVEKIVYVDRLVLQECPICQQPTPEPEPESQPTYNELHCPKIIKVEDSLGNVGISGFHGTFKKGSIDTLSFTITAIDPQGLPLYYMFMPMDLIFPQTPFSFEWSQDNTFTIPISDAILPRASKSVGIRVDNRDGYSCIGSYYDTQASLSYDVTP